MDNPLVSIIIPTYNRAHLISKSLSSISNQSFQNWECLIIDDGSKDDPAKITEWCTRDSRIVYLQRTGDNKKGLPSCSNGMEKRVKE